MPEDKKPEPEEEPMAKATLRIPERLWRKLRGRAGEAGMSANRYLEHLLYDLLGEPEPPEKGKKGAEVVFPTGGSPAMRTCDRAS